MIAAEELVLPAVAHAHAPHAVHGGARECVPVLIVVVDGPRVARHVPQFHIETSKGQLRTFTGIFQDDPGVVPGGAGQALPPMPLLVLGAEVPAVLTLHVEDCHVVDALGQRVVKHGQDGRERLVAKGRVPHRVDVRVPTVAHADDLVPDCRAEDALSPGHEEPHGHGLRVPPRVSVQAVHVAAEGGAPGDHVVPHVVQRPQQDRGDVQGDAAVPRQQGVHERVLLLGRVKLVEAEGQLDHADVLLHLVPVDYLEVEGALVGLDRLHAELHLRWQDTVPGVRTALWIIPVGPDGLLFNLPVHLGALDPWRCGSKQLSLATRQPRPNARG
mmetsp:Transcript_30082/g.68300  ORF Transcript_30082/g.68300 Transcript_30082/m.68300 type:complete len:329 (+) Transcript_30082:359-1345(+)